MEENISGRAAEVCSAIYQGLLTRIKKLVSQRGVLALPAMISVPVKVWFFYVLMGVKSNFVPVWLVTCLLLFLLFTSTKHKWIPAVIYLIISVLMFADVAYGSFFNRYLSVNMLGAAGFLGDVGDSIKEILRPKFFLLFVDTILVFASLIETGVLKKKDRQEDEERNDVDSIEAE